MRFNVTNATMDEAYGRIYGRQGIFRVDQSTGRPRYWVGRSPFNTPEEALKEIDRLGITNFTKFEAKKSIMPLVGAGSYKGIEEDLRSIRAAAKSIKNPELRRLAKNLTSIERYQYKGGENVLNVYNDLMKEINGKRISYGFDSPGDRLVVLRFFAGNEELTSDQIRKLQIVTGRDFSGAFMDKDGKRVWDPKFAKRMKTRVSLDDPSAMTMNRRLVVHKLDISDNGTLAKLTGLKKHELDKAFDGLIMVNPKLVREQAKSMKAEAKRLKEATGTKEEVLAARHAAEGLEKRAKELEKTARTGGSFSTFRAEGLVDSNGKDISALAKADALVAPGDAGWQKFAKEFGVNPNVDFAAHPNSLTRQIGLRGVGRRAYIGDKVDEANRHIFSEIESMTTTPEIHPLNDLSAHTLSVFKDRIDTFMATGKLPSDLREYYQSIIDKPLSEVTGNIFSHGDQVQRYKHLLLMESLGIDPHTDAGYANQVRSSMVEWIKGTKRPGDPRFLLPGTVGAHMRPAQTAKSMGYIDYDVLPGEVGFHRDVGVLLNARDAFTNHHLLGGFDLDDLVRNHMFNIVDESGKSKGIKAFLIRNPHSTGELISSNVAHGSMGEVALQLGKSTPALRKTNGYVILNTKAQLRALENDISTKHSEIRDLAAQGRPTTKKEHALEKYEIKHDRLSQKLEQLSEGMSQKEIDAIPENLLLEHLPKMKQAVFDEVEPISRPILKDKEGMWIPNKNPVYIDYNEWLAKFEGGKLPFESIKSRTKFTAEDLHMGRLGEMEGLDEITMMSRIQGVDFAKVYGLLGRYRNVDIMASSLRQQFIDLGIEGLIPSTPTEDITDVLKMGVERNGVTVDTAFERMTAMLYGMADAVANHGVKLSRELFEGDPRLRAAGKKSGRLITREEKEKFFGFLNQMNPNLALESIWLNNANTKEAAWNHHAMQVAQTKRNLDYINGPWKNEFDKSIIIPKELEEKVFTSEELNAAARIVTTGDVAREQLRRSLKTGRYQNMYQNQLLNDLEGSIEGSSAQETSRVLAETAFEDDGTLGERGLNILGAISREYGMSHGKYGFRGGIGEALDYANAYHRTGGFNREKLDAMVAAKEITPAQRKAYIELETKAPTRQSIMEGINPRPWIERNPEELAEEVEHRIRGGMVPGAIRNQAAREASGLARDVVSPTKFETIGFDSIKKLYKEHPGVGKASIAGAALVAGSFIYRKIRDRTPQDMQGPPLLPGGSAYEGSTTPTMPPGLDGGGGPPYTSNAGGGTTYRMMARGGFDPQLVRDQAESLTDTYGQSSGTIYTARNISRFAREVPEALYRAFRG